jgi:protein-S-isoprenylcysteine O-methyltransferase Ste14
LRGATSLNRSNLRGRIVVIKMAVHTLLWYVVIGGVLFIAAGTLAWPAAWFFLLEMVVVSLVGGRWLALRDPALMRSRLASPVQKHQPVADKAVVVAIILASFGALVVAAFDAVRFAWSDVPLWVRASGELILFLSLWLSFRVFAENSFAAPVVTIQRDREHSVIDTGPYRYVRHPMYAGALLFFAGMSLLLGSWWGLVPVLVLAVLFAVRIPIEEQVLRAGLDGYDTYAARVPYRLMPFVW